METFFSAAQAAIGAWTERHTGIRAAARPSQRAMLAASEWVRGDAEQAATVLAANRSDCLLFDVPLVRTVSAENGWLLFWLDRAAFDAYALLLPDTFAHGAAYLDKRMEILLRHGDMPLPDCDAILHAVLTASFAATREKWTPQDERTVLTMTHAYHGMDRVRMEQHAARAAKIILYERRNLL